MKKDKQKSAGFSFAEAIFVVAMMLIILVALLTIYENYTKVFGYQEILINTADSSRIAMGELKKFIQQSKGVVSSHSFPGKTLDSSQSAIALEIPSIDSSGNVLDGKSDFVGFYISGKVLNEIIEADASSHRPSGIKQLSDTVSSLTFTYSNADPLLATRIDVDLETQGTSRRQTATYNLHEEIYLRNK